MSGTAPGSRDTLLDAWRGFSVLLVIASHALPHFFPFVPGSGSMLNQVATYSGTLGVRIFFVISGYIITKLLIEERMGTGTVSLSSFYARRVFRIVPPLVLLLLVVAVLAAMGAVVVPMPAFLAASTFLCNTAITDCTPALGHLWTLGIEEQFYVFWPLVVLVLPVRLIPHAAATLLVVFTACDQLNLLKAGPIRNAAAFASIAAGALYASSARVRAFVRQDATGLFVCAAWGILFTWPWIPLIDPLQYQVFAAVLPALTLVVVFSSYRWGIERARFVRALAGVGLVSYGLYLYQQPFFLPGSPPFLEWLFIPLAGASYFLLERPAMAAGKMLTAARPAL